MPEPKHLLVVFHSQSGGAATMADAVLEGARSDEVDGVEVRVGEALTAEPEAVRWADAVILGTPCNFGYMSGALKHFFDRVYHPCLEDTRGLPYALSVKASTDGSGAVRSVQRIVAGLQWREVQPPLVVEGEIADENLDACRELGMAMAAGLELGVF